jgi:hypothetical protein
MLKPLPVGDHTIHMAGSVVNYAEATLNNFANEVKYLKANSKTVSIPDKKIREISR